MGSGKEPRPRGGEDTGGAAGRRRSGEERRAQIIDATLAILAERGLHAWTTAALAERVGVSEATLFRHFSDKEEILTRALRYQARALREHVAAYAEPPDPWDAIEGLVLHIFRFLVKTGGAPLIILSGQAVRMSGAVRRDVDLTMRTIHGRFTGLASRALDAGPPTAPIDPAVLAQLVMAIGQSTGLRWLISGRTLPLEDTARAMLRVLRGCVAGAGEGEA